MNYEKGKKTRLKNLLKEYRDHIITNKWDIMKNPPYDVGITEVIEVVDTAIRVIVGGL